jgi:hypothetical protein
MPASEMIFWIARMQSLSGSRYGVSGDKLSQCGVSLLTVKKRLRHFLGVAALLF